MTEEAESKSWDKDSPDHNKRSSQSRSKSPSDKPTENILQPEKEGADSHKTEKHRASRDRPSHHSKSRDKSDRHSGRSRSRDKRSHSKDKLRGSKEKRSRSKEKCSRSEEKRSHSKDRPSRSKDRSRDSRSKERSKDKQKDARDKSSRGRDKRSKSKERRSRSKERRDRSHEKIQKRVRDRIHRSRSPKRKDRSRSRERRGHHRESPGRSYRDHRRNERQSRSRSPFRGKFQNKAVLKAAAQQSVTFVKFAEATKDIGALTSVNGLSIADMVKPSNLPLNDFLTAGTTSGAMTPQMVLQQTMAAMSAQAQSLTGVALPKYYNPAAVNPLKYAEQMQKRKLLWQGAKDKEKPEEVQPKPTATAHWAQTSFTHDEDGKMSAKFRKLMGLKADEVAETAVVTASDPALIPDTMQKQEALFRDLDQQYEMARMSTHTHRGVGLGYSSQPPTLIFPK